LPRSKSTNCGSNCRPFSAIIRELIFNALKYSPAGSEISIYPQWRTAEGKRLFCLVVTNEAAPGTAKDHEGNPLAGIPYDYCEQVFDMFYTMDSAGHSLEGEEWTDGTGLYICRQLMKRMGGWIQAANASDYSDGRPRIVVNITLEFPLLD
jgi:signal transduction histidine kinase